jgi:tetratricopeptide (TPR) repeat protein
MPEYHTLQQAASRMGLPTNAVRALCQNEELSGAFQEHRRGPWRIPVESVDMWIEANLERRRNRRRRITRYITITGVTIAIALILAFVSGLADVDKAVQQLQQWGILKAYVPATSGETLIIVFDFDRTENVIDTNISGEIERAIRAENKNNNLNNVRVEIDPRTINPEEKERARKIGRANKASIVIWGQDTGARVTINFLNVKNPELFLSDTTIDETQKTQIASPSDYATFTTENLPSHLSTLSLFAIGQSLLIDRNFKDATKILAACKNSIEKDKGFEGEEIVYLYLGSLYMYENDYDKGLVAINKVLEFDPNNYGAYVNRGIIFGTRSEYTDAYADFNKAILLNPNEKVAYYNRGLTYAYEQKYPQAIVDFQKIIDDIDPNYAWAYYNRGLALVYRNETNDTDNAIKDFSKAIEINPRFWLAYQNRASLYYASGNYQGGS